ncbi:MAG: periplasmic heavy metal sensor [Acidobacteria bacterium]|nr:periplasmic heavy metal sensor [Acidobacteriota bacterium]
MRQSAYSLILMLLTAGGVFSQPAEHPDPIGDNLFPPELVMQHQQAIGLTEEQKTALKSDMQSAQARFTELQWALQEEMERMATVAKAKRIDEQQALAQLDKVLGVEREIKRAQLGLVIRIKNRLTPDQQAQLQAVRSKLRDK